MFAMLGGAAWAGGDLADVLAAQVSAGLEVVTDGRESVPEGGGAARLVDDLTAGQGIGSVERWAATVAAAPAVAVAAALPGPYSLARRAGPHGAGGTAADVVLVRALAEALAGEVGALVAAGCPLARVDEPGATAADDAERSAFIAAHRSIAAAAESRSAPMHLMLALTGGDHEWTGAPTLAGLGYASYLFDLIAGPADWRLIVDLPGDRGVVCGVVDPAASIGDAPEVLVWAAHYAASSRGRGLARVGLATTGSLAGLDQDAAVAKMRALGEGARIAALPAEEIRASLDPRAIDMRSAALGAWSEVEGLPRRPGV